MTTGFRNLVRAEDHGIELKATPLGDVFATSFSHDDLLYRVSGDHCDCKGFFYRGHCKHHALFVSRVLADAIAYFRK